MEDGALEAVFVHVDKVRMLIDHKAFLHVISLPHPCPCGLQQSCLKFSHVLGTTSLRSFISTRPAFAPPIVMSKKQSMAAIIQKCRKSAPAARS